MKETVYIPSGFAKTLVKGELQNPVQPNLDIQLELVKVQSIVDTDISESSSNSNFPPFKCSINIPLHCWSYNQFHNFTEFVSVAVLGQNDLSRSGDTC